MIYQYIYGRRNGKRRKVGVLVGATVRGQIVVGFSMCHPDDAFDKEKGLSIAIGRAKSVRPQECPPSILNDATMFYNRCMRYFKDAHINRG